MSVITLTKEESLDNNSVVQISPTATSARRSPLDFKAKFLRHLISKRAKGGFTLIELLVVVAIISILATITLPSFVKYIYKAKEVEATLYLSALMRAQQAYFLEHNHFANDIDELNVVLNITANYKYSTAPIPDTDAVVIYATPKNKNLSYFLLGVDEHGRSVWCKSFVDLILTELPPAVNRKMIDRQYCPLKYRIVP